MFCSILSSSCAAGPLSAWQPLLSRLSIRWYDLVSTPVGTGIFRSFDAAHGPGLEDKTDE